MPEARRLHLHIGLQKTGTSYLQAALLASRAPLARAGLDLVPPTKRESFELMLAVRERYGDRRSPASGQEALGRFSALLDRAPGTGAVFSQESLAAATRPQVARLLDACGDREVHVVVTVRDLARQVPSLWQESVKAGSTETYRAYLRRLQAQERAATARRPWLYLDAATVLDRWASAVPAERIHVVTVPPPGSPTTVLLERFARVLGVDPTLLTPEDRPSNSSLGYVQAEVLRRVNAELPEEVHRRDVYGEVVKRSFGREVLGAQERRKVLVPAQLRPWCEEATERQVSALTAGGYRVEGSLEELRCPDSAFSADGVGRPAEREVADASISALAAILASEGRREARRRDRGGDGELAGRGRDALRRLRRRLAPGRE